MTELTYNVVYNGKIIDGHSFDSVMTQLVNKFSLNLKKAEQLLKSKHVIIKKNLTKVRAKKYEAALKSAGLDVVLTQYSSPCEPDEPEKEDVQTIAAENTHTISSEKDISTASKPKEPDTINKEVMNKKTTLPFEFHGTGTEYFRIWVVNIILSIITLGIYSAWAKVRRKQYFYGSTSLQHSSFEYLADPVKILKGRIIVFVCFLSYSAISEFFPAIGGILSLLFVLLLPWIVVRALAFNARNSSYRNIRFGFNGSIKEAFKVFLLWPILVPFSLGTLFPYVYFRQKKYIVENSSYGKTQFTFNAGPKDYYGLIFKALVPIIIGLTLVIGTGFLLFPVSIFVSIVFYLYLFAYFSAGYTNLLYDSTKLSAHQFKANLIPMEYLILVVTNTLGMVLTFGIFYPWAQVRTLCYKIEHVKLETYGELNLFISQEQENVSALGDEAGDFFDMDIGL